MPDKSIASKSHQPKGLKILYEDCDIIVVDKASGLLSVGTDSNKQTSAHYHLNNYVRKGNPKSRERVFIVHRLDRDTSGLIIFARSEKAKFFLQDNWSDFRKKYLAVALGSLQPKEGIVESYLAENKAFKVFSTNDKSIGRYAKTGYKVIKETNRYSLLEIDLFTGRKNQIRVHLSEHGHPVAGDEAYGKADKAVKRLALHSYQIAFIHPFTKKEMVFKAPMPHYFNELMGIGLPETKG